MNRIFFLIGGNEGDREQLITQARQQIEKRIGCICEQSGIVESVAWGFESSNNFYNQVLEVETQLSANESLEITLKIEAELGRVRSGKGYAGRTMDIDILFFNNNIIDEAHLEVPHPRMHLRYFTLLPLVEKWPELMHPQLNKSMRMLLDECEDDKQSAWMKA